MIVCIWIVSDEGSRNKFSVSVPHDAKPIDVISETIRRRGRLMNITKEQVEGLIETYRTAYALKVCGCDEFLLEEYPISQYKVCVLLTNIDLHEQMIQQALLWVTNHRHVDGILLCLLVM